MFQGLRTVIYNPGDLEKGKTWYKQALGLEPYFDDPGYVGFNVGGYELGLNTDVAPRAEGAGVMAYWGVDDIEATFAHLKSIGATVKGEITEVGGGIKTAELIDPFGNLLGIIYNPEFKLP